jgi:hypothetical protein
MVAVLSAILLLRFQRLYRTGDFSEDFDGNLRPDVGLGLTVEYSGGTWMRSIVAISANLHPYADLGIL